MSKILYNEGGIYVSIYAGAKRADGGTRKRVQIAVAEGYKCAAGHLVDDNNSVISLSMEEWQALRAAAEQLGPDCAAEEVDDAPAPAA
jgi:hypothetical protein